MGAVPGVVYQGPAYTPDPVIQGSSPTLQGSSPNLQPTYNPQPGGATWAAPAPAPAPVNPGVNTNLGWFPSWDAYNYQVEQNRLAELGRQIDTAKTGVVESGNSAFDTSYNQMDTNARALATSSRNAQEDIDLGRQRVSLNRMRSINDLVGGIRQGLQSGSVKLSNMGALDSSAAEAMSRAYNQFGTQQRGGIMNQAALKNQEFDVQQRRAVEQRDEQARQIRMFKDTEVQRIGSQVANELRALDLQASQGGLSGRVAVEQLKAQVVNRGIQRLAEVDARMSQELGGIRAMSGDAIEAGAIGMNQAGTLPGNDFAYERAPGLQGNTQAAPISQLPIYTRRRDDRQGV